MKQKKVWAIMASSLLLLTACEKDHDGNPGNNDNENHVYMINNQLKQNFLVDYRRAANGTLHYDSSYATGGQGTGAGLGSQGAVTITSRGFVLVVNAGSNSVSSFKITSHGAVLQSTISSGGEKPISITEYNQLVYVLNAGGSGNISGFTLSDNGKLTAVANSTRPLSSDHSDPAQISFMDDGRALVVTEKGTNKIISYNTSGVMHTLTSAHPTPFGFAVGKNGNIIVSEAAGGTEGASTISSYRVDKNGVISLINGPVAAQQTAACWVVLTGNGKYAYATNTGSNTVTSLNVNNQGVINLFKANASATGTTPTDASLSNNSKYLYVLTAGSNSLNCYSVDQQGTLSAIQTLTNISGSTVGLAAE